MATLAQYMKRKKWTDQFLADLVGKDRSVITRIRLGSSLPSLKGAVEIERATGGKVPPRSFVRAPRAAEPAE